MLKQTFFADKSLFLASVMLMLGSVPIAGSEIYSVQLTMDGSAAPPGDLLTIDVLLDTSIKNAHIEVSAHLVTGEGNSMQQQVRTGNKQNADMNQFYLLKSILRREGANTEIEAESEVEEVEQSIHSRFKRNLTVAYRDLQIPKGEHQLGYLVSLVVDGKTASIRPTELTKVIITDKERTSLILPKSGKVIIKEEKEIEIPGGNVWKGGKLVPMMSSKINVVERLVVETTAVSDTKVATVAGEYRREGSDAATVLASRDFVPEPLRTVYFATNREVIDQQGTEISRFGDSSVQLLDKMSYGRCLVSIPINHHQPGNIEQPKTSWFFWREAADPKKHFVIERFDAKLGSKDFLRGIGTNDVLVYVHGYNNTFTDSILRSAQLQHDLNFSGKVVSFSWPSCGATLIAVSDPFNGGSGAVKSAYHHDEEVADKSPPFLADLLKQLLAREQTNSRGTSRRVHVLAHSMGNRVLLKALDQMNADGSFANEQNKLGQIILAAADVDGASFANMRDALKKSCERITFYFATNDGALRLSQTIKLDKPIGLGPLFDDQQMDTIDATSAAHVLNGMAHLYATEARPILTDLRLLVTRQLPPSQRRPPLGRRIEARELMGRFYWQLAP
jgi:esterase/lipase superfamily enzyme